MSTYAIDFETYYDDELSIKTLGTEQYLNHPDVYPYVVSIVGEGIRYSGPLEDAPWDKIDGHEWVSHNTYFDQFVFQIAKARKQVKTTAEPSVWHDTYDLAGYLSYPRSLKEFAHVTEGIEMDKSIRDNFLKGKHWRDLKDEDKIAVAEYALRDSEICLVLWNKYNHLWPEWERQVSLANRLSNMRGMAINMEKVNACVDYLRKFRFDIMNRLPWVAKGFSPLSKKAIDIACHDVGIEPPPSLSEKDEQFEEWVDQNLDAAPWMPLVANFRRTNKILKLCESFQQRVNPKTGVMSYSIKYCGADSTGRFSGDTGLNMQNFPKFEFPTVDLVDDETLKATGGVRANIRNFLIARPRHKLIIADYAQIEPRVLAWLVGDEAMLSSVRKGISVYEAHARATMGWQGGKLKEEDKALYALAKARVLGLGYGCGVDKFVSVARIMAGLEITLEMSQRCVADFRASNPKITEFWQTMASNAEYTFQSNAVFNKRDPFEVELPSGRVLRYLNLQKKAEFDPKLKKSRHQLLAQRTHGGNHTKIYGGKLVENIVQAVAADVLKLALVRLRDAGFKVLFHVHDEVIIEVPTSFKNLDKIRKVMCLEPEWMPGIPLEVEMEESKYYKK